MSRRRSDAPPKVVNLLNNLRDTLNRVAEKGSAPRRVVAFRAVQKQETPRTESPFLTKMRLLEMTSPEHARVLMNLADDILQDRHKHVWPWSDGG